MSGTTEGGKKAAKKNIEKYGADFYRKIGRKGGRNGHTGGFAANPELAKVAGRKGGKIGKRGSAIKITCADDIRDRYRKCDSAAKLVEARYSLLRSSSAKGWEEAIYELFDEFMLTFMS